MKGVSGAAAPRAVFGMHGHTVSVIVGVWASVCVLVFEKANEGKFIPYEMPPVEVEDLTV